MPTNDIFRTDLRRRRADSLAILTLRKIEQFIDYEEQRYVMRALIELFYESGVEVLTDHDRTLAGLPPRGPDGWTAEELFALETYRLNILSKPMTPLVFPIEVKP